MTDERSAVSETASKLRKAEVEFVSAAMAGQSAKRVLALFQDYGSALLAHHCAVEVEKRRQVTQEPQSAAGLLQEMMNREFGRVRRDGTEDRYIRVGCDDELYRRAEAFLRAAEA